MIQVATRGVRPGAGARRADRGGGRGLGRGGRPDAWPRAWPAWSACPPFPGLAGATPIKNVGAYGQEVSETITQVRVYDRKTGKSLEIPNEAVRLRLWHQPVPGRDRFVAALSVTFGLAVQVLLFSR